MSTLRGASRQSRIPTCPAAVHGHANCPRVVTVLAWLWRDGKKLRSRIETRDALAVQMHPDQLPVSVGTVRELVDQQFPEWRGLPIREVASQGTVNALFRIGDMFVARFPLEPGDVAATRRWIESEAQAARELLGCTRFLTPSPSRLENPARATRFRGRCRPGCRGLRRQTRTRASRSRLRRTWPSSSAACAQSTRAAGPSAEGVGEASCDPTMRGWKPASSAVDSSWMFRGFDASGQSCERCRGVPAT